mmetsp:Transcript_64837/g.163342  ORF Transcript_64837/g.163342 Transcript_64837/m.163342 type:complete len:385 (+) Transcript_64837:277-1431(+)
MPKHVLCRMPVGTRLQNKLLIIVFFIIVFFMHGEALLIHEEGDAYEAIPIHHQALRAVLPMAGVKPGLIAAQGVQASVGRRVPEGACPEAIGLWGEHLGRHIVEVPPKGLALQFLPELPPRLKIPQGHPSRQRGRRVLHQLGVLVHPYSCSAKFVPRDVRSRDLVSHTSRILALPESRVTEDVEDMGARNEFDVATALPGAKANLHLLAAVETHTVVVSTQVQEESPVRGEQAACHNRRLQRLHGVPSDGLRPLPQRPTEAQHAEPRAALVCKVVEVNAVDARDHDVTPVFVDPRQQWFQPPGRGLDVAVQEDDHFSCCSPCPFHPRQHQAPPLAQSHQAELWQLADILREGLLQAVPTVLREPRRVWRARIVYEDDLDKQIGR